MNDFQIHESSNHNEYGVEILLLMGFVIDEMFFMAIQIGVWTEFTHS